MEALSFFDANAWLGIPVFDPHTGAYSRYSDRDDLLAAMDFYGVELRAGEPLPLPVRRPHEGQPAAAARRSPAASACSRAGPCCRSRPGRFPAAGELAAELRRDGVRAVRLVPGAVQPGVPREDCCATCSRMLEQEGVLLILQLPTLGVPVPEKEDVYLRALDELCAAHPRLTRGGRRAAAQLLPAAGAARAASDLPGLGPAPGLRGGRLPPFRRPPPAVRHPLQRERPRDQRHAHAAGHPRGGQRRGEGPHRGAETWPSCWAGCEPPAAAAQNRAPRSRELLAGRPSPFPIIDVHAHVGAWNWEYKPASGLADLAPVMDRLGVREGLRQLHGSGAGRRPPARQRGAGRRAARAGGAVRRASP